MYIRQTPAVVSEAAAVPVAVADSVPAADSLPRMKKRRAPAFDVSNAFDTKKRRFLSIKFEYLLKNAQKTNFFAFLYCVFKYFCYLCSVIQTK